MGIVAALACVQFAWAAPRSPATSMRLADGWDGVQGDLEQQRVVDVGGREDYGEQDARAVDDEIRLIRWSVTPPPSMPPG